MTQSVLTTAQKAQALGICPLFASVRGDGLMLLAEMMCTESLRPGESLFEAGEPSDRVFVLVSGRVEVLLAGANRPLRTMGSGEVLGEYGMFANEVRTASVRAREDTTLISLDYDRFRSYLLHCPQATLKLLETSVRRLVAAERAQA
jgi:CRP-like cAMP-binding protein